MNVIAVWFVVFTFARFIHHSQYPSVSPDVSLQDLQSLCVQTEAEVPVRWGKLGYQIIYKFERRPVWTISDRTFANAACRLHETRVFETHTQCQDFFKQFSVSQLSSSGRLKCSNVQRERLS